MTLLVASLPGVLLRFIKILGNRYGHGSRGFITSEPRGTRKHPRSIIADIPPHPVCCFLFVDPILGNLFGPRFILCLYLFVCCFVVLNRVNKTILRNHYGPGVSSRASQGGRTHDQIDDLLLF